MRILWFVVFLLFLLNVTISRCIHSSRNNDSPLKKADEMKDLHEPGALNKSETTTLATHYLPGNKTNETSETNGPQDLTEKMNTQLFQGDIRLTEMQWKLIYKNSNTKYERKSMRHGMEFRWSLPIAYYISPSVDESAIEAGVALWQQDTCIQFVRHNTLPEGPALRFVKGAGCSSWVGKIGEIPQDLSIGKGCTDLSIVAHEIGHALGLWHEQSRQDRDYFVNILTGNIDPNKTHNFVKEVVTDNYGVGYDYGSIMHYGPKEFNVNDTNTITTKYDWYQTVIGQASVPSFADIKKINLAYCSSTCNTNLQCENGGYVNPKDCSRCHCPEGLEGTLCEKPAMSSGECGDVTPYAADFRYKYINVTGNATCNYLITSSPGSLMYFSLMSSNLDCSESFLKFTYMEDLSTSGVKFCQAGRSQLSRSNNMLVLYKGVTGSHFELQYVALAPVELKRK